VVAREGPKLKDL